MDASVVEQHFTCPYCGERVSVLLDLSIDGAQSYIEDCEVCCQPIQLTISAEDGRLCDFQFERSV